MSTVQPSGDLRWRQGGVILVVAWELAIQRAAAVVIADLGVPFMIASDGAEGLRLARRYQPRVILTDALLPRLDGRQLCRALKQDPACAASRVILMTALYQRPKHELEARRPFGPDDLLLKPIESESLRRTLNRQLARMPAAMEWQHA